MPINIIRFIFTILYILLVTSTIENVTLNIFQIISKKIAIYIKSTCKIVSFDEIAIVDSVGDTVL